MAGLEGINMDVRIEWNTVAGICRGGIKRITLEFGPSVLLFDVADMI